MNHRIHFLKEDVIVSDEEYQFILGQIKNGIREFYLRDGKLVLNIPSGIAYTIVETEQPTLEQEEKRRATLRLESASDQAKQTSNGNGLEYLAKTHDAYYAKMRWEHKDNCICKTSDNFKNLMVDKGGLTRLQQMKNNSGFGNGFS